MQLEMMALPIFSDDGGNNWQIDKVHENFGNRDKIVFINPILGFIVGYEGRILINESGGNNWRPLYETFNATIHTVEFVNSQIGWAGGTKWVNSLKAVMFKTTDGGYTWTPQQVDGAYVIIDIEMFDDRNGWAVGGGRVFRTIDGGENWTSFSFLRNSHIRGVHFLDKNFGVVYEVWDQRNNQLYNYITLDGGKSWTQYELPETSSFSKLKFTDYNHGWMLNSEALWYSADTSKTWTKNPNIDVQNGFSFDFIDNNTGWVAANFNEVYRTYDGGNSWETSTLPFTNQTFDMVFVDKQRGFISGNNGVIFVTNDGGKSWLYESSFTSGWLLAVNSYSDGKTIDVWVAGKGFPTLFKSLLVTSVNDPRDAMIINEFTVAQNYPNPFNAMTQIQYYLPKTTSVILKIYDILGREVRTLVNEYQNVGSHLSEWDGTDDAGQNVSSALYIYRLTADGYNQIKKMILLK